LRTTASRAEVREIGSGIRSRKPGPQISENGFVKTTIDLPDALFRRAKSAAVEEGKSLKEFFTEAVAGRLGHSITAKPDAKPWEALLGGSSVSIGKTCESIV
jgi:hypothetical protein